MINLTIRRLHDDQVQTVIDWLAEVDGPRRDEAIETLVAEGVRHETAAVLRTGDGSYLIYAMEADDFERVRAVGAASDADIDKKHHEVMAAALTGRSDVTRVLDIAP
ncbi:DUF6176 family protein [Gryllotalpicola protaetiae]|uniref:Uncharacterized protein n=1 Tax=Gryllotalpicola protaetiae TaxID=2419771 RepID=A0A387BPN5_9MICO|nr:DUF6176 family protein [Gryllotalpicola protaetiae]AYG02916.1 hypothetical protein D7I44_04840 [Gryllotalpicola protaetiae]